VCLSLAGFCVYVLSIGVHLCVRVFVCLCVCVGVNAMVGTVCVGASASIHVVCCTQ
jgi:hypothetical protein